MKRNSHLLSLAAALTFAVASTQVRAQQSGSGLPMGPRGMMGMMQMMADCPMMGPMMGMSTEEHGSAFSEGRIAFLKAELAITDAQKPAWDAYAAAIKANLQSMQDMMQTMRAVFDAKTPVERLDAHLAAMEARLKALKDVKPAASVIARFSDPDRRFLTPRGERQPFFVLQKVGKGSVFYIGSPEMWRLRWNDTYHERFWTKLMRHFSKRETPRGLLVVGSRYAEGDYVVVEAQLFDAELKPLKVEGDAKVLLRVLPPANVADAPKEWADGMAMKADAGRPGWFTLRFPVRRAGKYGLELKFPGSNEKLTGKFRVETTDPERDDTKPNFALMHRLASEAKDVRLHDEQQSKVFAEALNKAKESVLAEAKDAPPGITVLTAENQGDRLFFNPGTARWIGECLESNNTPFRTEGKVADLWDKGWTVFADIEHPDKASGPPWALVLLVLLFSAEWLTRKLLKLA